MFLRNKPVVVVECVTGRWFWSKEEKIDPFYRGRRSFQVGGQFITVHSGFGISRLSTLPPWKHIRKFFKATLSRLKWKWHYLSLQSWHSPIFYDVWILHFCWLRYFKRDCLKRDLPFQLIFFHEWEIQIS